MFVIKKISNLYNVSLRVKTTTNNSKSKILEGLGLRLAE